MGGVVAARGPWVGFLSGDSPGGESGLSGEDSPRGSVAFRGVFGPFLLSFARFRQPLLLAFGPFLPLFCLSFFLPFQSLFRPPSLPALSFFAAFFLQGRFSSGRRGLPRSAGDGLE